MRNASAPKPALAAADHEQGYTSVQSARITGLTPRRLAYLAQHDLVVPSIKRPAGKRLHYSFSDLLELRTIARLTAGENRASIRRVRQVVEALRGLHNRPLLTCTLVVCDGEVLWADEETRSLFDVVRGFQTMFVVNLAYVETDVRQALAREGLRPPHQHATEARAA
jgi:DNA-binding transcriptional MerR regulator